MYTSAVSALITGAMPAAAQSTENNSGSESAANGNMIVVTAQRREQTLIEIPQSISVLDGDLLELQQATDILDFVSLVPGLTATEAGPGRARVVIRGLNTGSVGSTVGIYVDDVPFGASGSLSNAGALAGDFDTFDIARVEVLKGPQGTLYGANTLGGVLKYVTASPDTSGFDARAQAGVEAVKGGGTGLSANAMINVPLGDNLAFRASGYYRDSPGYLDAIGRPDATDINRTESYGGRATLLFEPSEEFSIKLFGLFQNSRSDASSVFVSDPLSGNAVNPLTGAIQENAVPYQRRPEFNDVDYRLYSGTVSYDFGFAEVTSITSYAEQTADSLVDLTTNAIRPLLNTIYAPLDPATLGLSQVTEVNVEKFVQEVRLASPDSEVFEWMVGGFYTKEDTELNQLFSPFSLITQQTLPGAGAFVFGPFDEFIQASLVGSYEEVAVFGSATLLIGDRFDITAGGRYSRNNQNSDQFLSQLGIDAATAGGSSQGVFTWSIAPRFEISENASIYGRVGKGYRPGGPNFVPAGAPANFPLEFNADTLINYEMGLRAGTADGTFSIDASVFYIDWKDILIATTVLTDQGQVGINTNGQRAESYGAEIAAVLRPTSGLTVAANVTYNKTSLLDDTIPAAGGPNITGGLAGDPLPLAPEWNATVTVDYAWSLSDTVDAFVGGNISLVGDRSAGFQPAFRAAFGRLAQLDSYTTVDLRAGVQFDQITISAYVKNLTNEDGQLFSFGFPYVIAPDIGGTGAPLANSVNIRPRSIGATIGFTY